MNRGVVEQLGPPQEIYDRPASMFVADFIGSPAMNLLPFQGALDRGRETGRRSTAPRSPSRELREDGRRARSWCSGVRPEHIRFDDRIAACAARCSAPNIWARPRS